ncbi:YdbH family protein [Otariodibacter sp.]|uniref:YdbH family protein n=1 Tax=Otariodibacter sp. TaxID=3030919 RepID=UPI0026151F73|nr:YdbH family protein [Otariodibacter sp.]
MLKRGLIILASIIAILISGGLALMSGSQLATTINWILPDEWKAEIPKGISPGLEGASLPFFSLAYQNCTIISTDDLNVQWANQNKITLQQAIIDYSCLALLPTNNKDSSSSADITLESLASIFSMVPNGLISVNALSVIHLPDEINPRLKSLLEQPNEITFTYFNDTLTTSLAQKNLNLSLNFENQTLAGNIIYKPNKNTEEIVSQEKKEQHQLSFSTVINNQILSIPPKAQLEYNWYLPENMVSDPDLQQGNMTLAWEENDEHQFLGDFVLHSSLNPNNKIELPINFDGESLNITRGYVNWLLSEDFTLRGFITTSITPNSFYFDDLYPVKTTTRISLLTNNRHGKGNVVINNLEGILQKDSFNLPLQITGNIKQDNFIVYTSLPLDFKGEYDNPVLRFLPGSLLRMTGAERLLTIRDLRFPMAGLLIDKYGITGRLQAILKAESPDFDNIELHLDGFARKFKAGLLSLFTDPMNHETVTDLWQWRFWGESAIKAFNSSMNIAGRGNWQKNIIQLSEFEGNIGKIQQNAVLIPNTTLTLANPITFAYEVNALAGGLQLDMQKIQFDYGGEFESPTGTLNFDGKLENLRLNGEISSGKLGPIRFFARRELTPQSSNIIGKLYWAEQPADVFQSLFPIRSNWIITNGTIRGETSFSANAERGLIAGGHFAIRNGEISLPNGSMQGIEFSLPYQYQNNEFDIGAKQALDVKIAEIDVGIKLNNAKMKIQGHYPYSKKRPLTLRELSFNLLGGKLTVDKFALPQTQIAYLNLFNIHFEDILSLAQYRQIDLKGQANAILPFWLSGNPCYICEGTLVKSGESTLKFTPELLNAIKEGGYTEQLLMTVVNNSSIDELNAKVNLDSAGLMNLKTSLKIHSLDYQKTKANLNYNHQENIFDLWKLINYGSEFEQNIEHSIYKRLDNQ